MAIQSAIDEVKRIVLSMQLSDIFFDGLLILTLSLMVTAAILLPWYLALIPFITYLSWNMLRATSGFTYAYVEERVPELNEMLRTAADYANEHNEVLDELFKDVIQKLRHLRTSYFVEFSRIAKQIVFLSVFCFLVIAISALNVNVVDIDGVLDQGALLGRGYDPEKLDPLDKGDEAYLYGEEESIAEAGTEELSLELTPLSTDVDVTKERDIDESKFENMYPEDVGAQVNDNYADQIPRKYKDIVKNYFKTIPT